MVDKIKVGESIIQASFITKSQINQRVRILIFSLSVITLQHERLSSLLTSLRIFYYTCLNHDSNS